MAGNIAKNLIVKDNRLEPTTDENEKKQMSKKKIGSPTSITNFMNRLRTSYGRGAFIAPRVGFKPNAPDYNYGGKVN